MKQCIFIFLTLILSSCGKNSDESLQVIPDNKIEHDLLYRWEKIRYSIDQEKFNELFSLNSDSAFFFKIQNKENNSAFVIENKLINNNSIPYHYILGCLTKDNYVDLKLKNLDQNFDSLHANMSLHISKNFLIPSSKFENLKINLYFENVDSNDKQILETKIVEDLYIIELSKTIERNKAFRFTENTCLTMEIESFTLNTEDRDIFYHKNMNLRKIENSSTRVKQEIKRTILDNKAFISVDNFLPSNSLIIKGELSATPQLPDEFFILPVRCKSVNFGPQPKSNCTCLGKRSYEIQDYNFNENEISLSDDIGLFYQADYAYQNYREYKVDQLNNLYPTFSFKSEKGFMAKETITYKTRHGAAICPETKIQEIELDATFSLKGEMEISKTLQ